MTDTNNKPAHTVRFAGIKGTIWRNPGVDGKPPRYNAVYTRTYRTNDGKYHDTDSLSKIDSLKLGHLIPKVIATIEQLEDIDRSGIAEEGGQ